MNRSKLLSRVGSMQQLAYVRGITVNEGRANMLRASKVVNGAMSYLVMEDKCLDIGALNYRGENLIFLSKPGLNGRNPFDTNGLEAQRSIMGGLFFTCGFENICAPYGKYPMHGRMRTTPAEHVCRDSFWDGDRYILRVSGEMREAELFGENMVLRREVRSCYGERVIEIHDEITNEGFRPEPMMLMYHCNFGYPLLDQGTELILPSLAIEPRDKISALHTAEWETMPLPTDCAEECVYIHTLASNKNGNTFAAIVNLALGIGVRIDFNKNDFPWFMQWKSTASGDYVMGLEPSNSCVYGRRFHEEHNDLPMLAPQKTKKIQWSFTVLDGEADIRYTLNECARLKGDML